METKKILETEYLDCNVAFSILEENYQAQIAAYYNIDKSEDEMQKRSAVIQEYKDLIGILKFRKQTKYILSKEQIAELLINAWDMGIVYKGDDGMHITDKIKEIFQ